VEEQKVDFRSISLTQRSVAKNKTHEKKVSDDVNVTKGHVTKRKQLLNVKSLDSKITKRLYHTKPIIAKLINKNRAQIRLIVSFTIQRARQ
jgi:hypothetical protein